jgi:protein-S-isoprenylcysteine O-methyltransferase Ste14
MVGSAGILAFSWDSLKNPESHGTPRFFAFELLLGMVILNAPLWFTDPGSPHQLVSWVLLAGSAWLAWEGYSLLRSAGKPKGKNFEKTTRLVTKGVYAYIRHPMYASLLLLGLGVFYKDPESWLNVLLVLLLLAALVATARFEEAENLARLGRPYAAYMKRTKRFLPFVA